MRTSQAPRLTPRRIESLPPRDKPYRVPDCHFQKVTARNIKSRLHSLY